MLEKGRRSDSSQFIPTRWGSPATYFRASDISKKHHRCLRALHVQILKRRGKSLLDLCAPKAKLPTSTYWFLAKVSPISENTERIKKAVQLTKIGQLQKSGTVFQPSRISSSVALHRLSLIGKQYTKILGEYDTWSPAYSNF